MNKTLATFMGLAITGVIIATLIFGNMFELLRSIATDLTNYISNSG